MPEIQRVTKGNTIMKMLNEQELNLVNGGIICLTPPFHEERVRIDEENRREKWLKWVRKEKQKMEGLADIRLRAGENALRAAMRIHRAELDIKAAQRAAMVLD